MGARSCPGRGNVSAEKGRKHFACCTALGHPPEAQSYALGKIFFLPATLGKTMKAGSFFFLLLLLCGFGFGWCLGARSPPKPGIITGPQAGGGDARRVKANCSGNQHAGGRVALKRLLGLSSSLLLCLYFRRSHFFHFVSFFLPPSSPHLFSVFFFLFVFPFFLLFLPQFILYFSFSSPSFSLSFFPFISSLSISIPAFSPLYRNLVSPLLISSIFTTFSPSQSSLSTASFSITLYLPFFPLVLPFFITIFPPSFCLFLCLFLSFGYPSFSLPLFPSFTPPLFSIFLPVFVAPFLSCPLSFCYWFSYCLPSLPLCPSVLYSSILFYRDFEIAAPLAFFPSTSQRARLRLFFLPR